MLANLSLSFAFVIISGSFLFTSSVASSFLSLQSALAHPVLIMNPVSNLNDQTILDQIASPKNISPEFSTSQPGIVSSLGSRVQIESASNSTDFLILDPLASNNEGRSTSSQCNPSKVQIDGPWAPGNICWNMYRHICDDPVAKAKTDLAFQSWCLIDINQGDKGEQECGNEMNTSAKPKCCLNEDGNVVYGTEKCEQELGLDKEDRLLEGPAKRTSICKYVMVTGDNTVLGSPGSSELICTQNFGFGASPEAPPSAICHSFEDCPNSSGACSLPGAPNNCHDNDYLLGIKYKKECGDLSGQAHTDCLRFYSDLDDALEENTDQDPCIGLTSSQCTDKLINMHNEQGNKGSTYDTSKETTTEPKIPSGGTLDEALDEYYKNNPDPCPDRNYIKCYAGIGDSPPYVPDIQRGDFPPPKAPCNPWEGDPNCPFPEDNPLKPDGNRPDNKRPQDSRIPEGRFWPLNLFFDAIIYGNEFYEFYEFFKHGTLPVGQALILPLTMQSDSPSYCGKPTAAYDPYCQVVHEGKSIQEACGYLITGTSPFCDHRCVYEWVPNSSGTGGSYKKVCR